MIQLNSRREFLIVSSAALFTGSAASAASIAEPRPSENPSDTAYEELMSEHSILRRAMYIYLHVADMALEDPRRISTEALAGTATLFRRYGEEFHERILEERHVFPQVRKLAPEVRAMPDVLVAQHDAGRLITNYVIDMCASGRIPQAHAASLAQALREFVWMYQNHAAREDTELFPAWKKMLGNEYEEASREFDRLARQTFGADGFQDAARQLAVLEAEFGLANLAAFTAEVPELAVPLKGRN
jgi:hemerythrin-like domain-containing protein